jgi:hypothetical protein
MKTRNLFRGLRLSTTLEMTSIKSAMTVLIAVFLFTGSWSLVSGQVKIGGDSSTGPASGAVLDLSSATSGGLLLPQVTLSTATALPNEWVGIIADVDLLESGLIVYNLGGADALAPGVYVWQGTLGWALANSAAPVGPVPESIVVTADPTGQILVDATQTLTATVFPVNAGWTTVNWGGNNPSVAIVDAVEGSVNTATVTGIHNGTTTVTASLDGVSSDPFTIQIGIPAIGIAITGATSPASLSVGGKTLQLGYSLTPGNSTDVVSWESSEPDIASIDATSGLVTSSASTTGSTVITATAGDATSDPFIVNVVTCGAPFTAPSGKVYNTAAYSNANLTNLCWTISNLQEAGYGATCFSNDCETYPTRGYYYAAGTNPNTACAALNSSDGNVWRVPTTTEWGYLLAAYPTLSSFDGATETTILQADWVSGEVLVGVLYRGAWGVWGAETGWWSQGSYVAAVARLSNNTMFFNTGDSTNLLPVRCVRDL